MLFDAAYKDLEGCDEMYRFHVGVNDLVTFLLLFSACHATLYIDVTSHKHGHLDCVPKDGHLHRHLELFMLSTSNFVMAINNK